MTFASIYILLGMVCAIIFRPSRQSADDGYAKLCEVTTVLSKWQFAVGATIIIVIIWPLMVFKVFQIAIKEANK